MMLKYWIKLFIALQPKVLLLWKWAMILIYFDELLILNTYLKFIRQQYKILTFNNTLKTEWYLEYNI